MILVLNTATRQFSLALMDPTGLIKAEFSLAPGAGHFQELAPAVEYLFATSGVSIADLKGITAVKGPGSFTGLRVGLAFVKGLCHSQQVPAIGVSSLEAFALQIPFSSLPVCPLIGSRRDEVFTALYAWDGTGRLQCLKQECCLKIHELAAFVDKPVIFIGDDFRRLNQELTALFGFKALLAPADLWMLKASAAGRLGLERFLKGDYDDLSELNPTYMRQPDIRPNPIQRYS